MQTHRECPLNITYIRIITNSARKRNTKGKSRGYRDKNNLHVGFLPVWVKMMMGWLKTFHKVRKKNVEMRTVDDSVVVSDTDIPEVSTNLATNTKVVRKNMKMKTFSKD